MADGKSEWFQMAKADRNRTCLSCEGTNLFESVSGIDASGIYGPHLLPGLGGFWSYGKLQAIVCGDCGFMHYHASSEALKKLPNSGKWRRL